jgi:hypothetical protein
MTNEEWEEMQSLKDAINYSPSSVHPDKMERFTELFVKSLEGKGVRQMNPTPTNY